MDIKKIAPDGWFKAYIEYCESLTDAPAEFHLITGLSLLSVAAGSSVTYQGFGGGESWCNLYALIIAPTGLFRKSTALSIGSRILRQANKDLLLPNEQTREKFLNELRDKPTSILFVPEFSAQLSLWQREYMGGMREIITELFDPTFQYTRQTMKGDKIMIIKPALSILAASTADWLMERLTIGDLRGGLMGRFLICAAKQKTQWHGLPPEPDKQTEKELADYLADISTITHAPVNVAPIRNDFNNWLKAKEKQIDMEGNPEMVGFYSRLGAHTLKVAILFHVAYVGMAKSYELDVDSLAKACTLMDYLTEGLRELTQTTLVGSKTEQELQGLLKRIRKNGGIDHRTLLRGSHLKIREFEALINTLKSRGEITENQRKSAGRPSRIYEPVTEVVKEVA